MTWIYFMVQFHGIGVDEGLSPLWEGVLEKALFSWAQCLCL
jgi:hypothetical protein